MENMTEPAPYVEGKTTIAPEVLLTIARLTTLNVNGVSRICHLPSAAMRKLFKRGHVDEGVAIEIIDGVVYADIYVILEHNYNVREVSHSIQVEVTRAITEMVGMQVGSINVHIEDIDYPSENEA
jgi:uncharacterized alkaline shock family protein YloU